MLGSPKVLAIVILIGHWALAQGDIQEIFRVPASSEKPEVFGWIRSANLGVNLSFSSSQDVVGQTDGTNQTYGVNLTGDLNRISKDDEWRNSLSILENTSKTPNIPRFVKSGDELKLVTTYLYRLPTHPSIGPFARGEVAAPLFFGEDVRSSPQTYRRVHSDGSSDVFQASSARLTDGFRPFTSKESVGGFWKMEDRQDLKVEFRMGFGAMQLNAAKQFASRGANSAGQIELNELSNIKQGGLLGAADLKGKLDERSVYSAGLETLVPISNNRIKGDSRNAIELTDVEGFAKFSTTIASWVSLTYDYKLKIQPQLVNRAQQQHMVVFNLNYNIL